MKARKEPCRAELVRLLEALEQTVGMGMRSFCDRLILGHPDLSAHESEPNTGDPLRLTALSARRWPLTGGRLEGRWDQGGPDRRSMALEVQG